MINICLDMLFGCSHRNQTRPITLNKHCYTVCLECGEEMPYSWGDMRPMSRSECAAERRHAGEFNTAAAA